MELRQLAYFDAVVRHGSFTSAAAALHIAQPAISAQIKNLETELGVRLLDRTTRRCSPTAAGEQFLLRARVILTEVDSARSDMTSHAELLTGHVVIGTTPVLGGLRLAAVVAEFRRRYPGVTVELRSGLVADLLDQCGVGDIDLVIGPDHGRDTRFDVQRLASERFVVICPPGDDRTISTLAQLVAEPFVTLARGSGVYTALTADLDVHVAIETFSPVSVRELVSNGAGVALIAESMALSSGPPVGVHRVPDAPEHPPICAFRRRGLAAPAVRALSALLEDA